MLERTFAMVKPDGVSRGLVGEIIISFERAGLKILALEMRRATADLVEKHYPSSDEWFMTVGGKTLKGYSELGVDVVAELGTDDRLRIGKMVKSWLADYITSGPVVAMVLEGESAIANVRRLCGNTLPVFADPGSIRGRYCIDTPVAANAEKRPVYNVIHASGDQEEARNEIGLWFPKM